MEPLVNQLVVAAARGAAHSALPHAPVVTDRPPVLAGLRRRTGHALHAAARRVEPGEAPIVEGARYRAA